MNAKLMKTEINKARVIFEECLHNNARPHHDWKLQAYWQCIAEGLNINAIEAVEQEY